MFYALLRLLAKIIMPFKYHIDVQGTENLPPDRPFIISANHVSCADPILLSLLLKEDIHFLTKQELFKHPAGNWFFNKLNAVSVDRQSPVQIKPVR